VAAAGAGQIHGATELLAQCAMLLFAGYETTRHSLGTSLYWLLSHPEEWGRLQSDPSLLPGAIRELLRWDGPVQYTGRCAAGGAAFASEATAQRPGNSRSWRRRHLCPSPKPPFIEPEPIEDEPLDAVAQRLAAALLASTAPITTRSSAGQ
jgi:hypothetical protein